MEVASEVASWACRLSIWEEKHNQVTQPSGIRNNTVHDTKTKKDNKRVLTALLDSASSVSSLATVSSCIRLLPLASAFVSWRLSSATCFSSSLAFRFTSESWVSTSYRQTNRSDTVSEKSKATHQRRAARESQRRAQIVRQLHLLLLLYSLTSVLQ